MVVNHTYNPSSSTFGFPLVLSKRGKGGEKEVAQTVEILPRSGRSKILQIGVGFQVRSVLRTGIRREDRDGKH